jgi:hypothetical protein
MSVQRSWKRHHCIVHILGPIAHVGHKTGRGLLVESLSKGPDEILFDALPYANVQR